MLAKYRHNFHVFSNSDFFLNGFVYVAKAPRRAGDLDSPEVVLGILSPVKASINLVVFYYSA